MRRARGALLATVLLVCAAGGCSAGRERRAAASLAAQAGGSACADECGPRPANPLASRAVGCEGTLNDLCRARCEERHGEASGALRERTAALEDTLEHHCGSGQPMAGELPWEPPPEAAPRPLDRLLRAD